MNELNRNLIRDILINKYKNFIFDQIKDIHYICYSF